MTQEYISLEKCLPNWAYNIRWKSFEPSVANKYVSENYFRTNQQIRTQFPQEWRTEEIYYQNLFNVVQDNLIWTWQGSSRINTGFVPVQHYEFYARETLYITAIKNLIKQKEFLSLMYQVASDQLSEEEFNQELESNESKYLIHINDKADGFNFQALLDVIVNLGIELTLDEVSEMFGIDQNILEEYPLNFSPAIADTVK